MLQPRPAVLLGLLLISVLARLMPYILYRFGLNIDPATTVYPWNFTPFLPICLFGAAYLKQRWWAYAIPLSAYVLGDLGIWALTGRFDWAVYPNQPMVYGCVCLTVTLGLLLRRNGSSLAIAGTGFSSAVLFFLITNFGVWATGGGNGYSMDMQGLLNCYTLALPYFRNSLISMAVFCPLLFSRLALMEPREAAQLWPVTTLGR